MKNRRDIFILVGLFVILIIFLALSPRLLPPEVKTSVPTTRSTEAEGAQALYRWLGDMGYAPQRLEYRAFSLASDDDALIILNPSEPITEDEADTALAWVERGGTLVLADDTASSFGPQNALLEQLDVSFEVYTSTNALSTSITQAQPRQPALVQPAFPQANANTSRMVVAPNRPDVVTLLGSDDAPVIVGLKYERGYIYLSAATYPFTNEGLRSPGNGELVLNMLRRVPAGGSVLFDEYHLGYFEPPSPAALTIGSPLGIAMAYAILATALYLILGGRRFGRPVPTKAELARRTSAEYVQSIADLLQRGQKREYIAAHFHTRARRRLARRFGLNPNQDDAALAREIALAQPTDEAALASLLGHLRAAKTDDALIHALRQADEAERR